FLKGLSPHQDFSARAIGGLSGGALPPQRLFAVGGLGSVHGYDFKSSIGTSMALANLEYALGWRGGFQMLGFYDAGRTSSNTASSSTEWLNGVGFGFAAGDIRID